MYMDYLAHYGVKGMKWGVRRYENYNGSYTKKGVEKYKKSLSKYNKAVEDYKSGKIEKAHIKTAKKEMNKNYKNLKRDKLADQGKELYKQGKRITANAGQWRVASIAAAVSGGLTYGIVSRYKDTKTAAISATAVSAGALAVKGIIGAKSMYEDRRLRAYYGH